MILNKKQHFRKRLSQLGQLVEHRTQIVLLTATLPPRYQSDLFNKLYIKESDMKIYRSPSNRSNIHYLVRLNQSQDQILHTIQQKSNQYPSDRLIVYTRTREIAENLKKQFKWPVYYSNSTGRQQVLHNFLDSNQKNQRIIATSSLGLGLNIPNARSIIHIKRPFTLYDYAQESGRAGRDQVSSEAILMISSNTIQLERQLTGDERREDTQISHYMGSQYRRYYLSEYLDNSGVDYQENNEKCDIYKSITSIFLLLIDILTYI